MSKATTDQFDKARFDRRKVSICMVDSPTEAEAERKSGVREF